MDQETFNSCLNISHFSKRAKEIIHDHYESNDFLPEDWSEVEEYFHEYKGNEKGNLNNLLECLDHGNLGDYRKSTACGRLWHLPQNGVLVFGDLNHAREWSDEEKAEIGLC